MVMAAGTEIRYNLIALSSASRRFMPAGGCDFHTVNIVLPAHRYQIKQPSWLPPVSVRAGSGRTRKRGSSPMSHPVRALHLVLQVIGILVAGRLSGAHVARAADVAVGSISGG
jgi:hypothetical protein